jgi:hypothetical protein
MVGPGTLGPAGFIGSDRFPCGCTRDAWYLLATFTPRGRKRKWLWGRLECVRHNPRWRNPVASLPDSFYLVCHVHQSMNRGVQGSARVFTGGQLLSVCKTVENVQNRPLPVGSFAHDR